MPRFVIVSGLPASGKSSAAQVVAPLMKLPVFDKDAYLEAPFDQHGVGDAAWRRELSRMADQSLIDAVGRSAGAVVVSWWRHPESSTDSGTPTEWLRTLAGDVRELYCQVRPEVAAARFVRRQRHPGHLDASRSEADLIKQFSDQAKLGPLGFGKVCTVNGDRPLAQQLARLLDELDA